MFDTAFAYDLHELETQEQNEEHTYFIALNELRKQSIYSIASRDDVLQTLVDEILQQFRKNSSKDVSKYHYLYRAIKEYSEKFFSLKAIRSLRFYSIKEHYCKLLSYSIVRYRPKLNIVKKSVKTVDVRMYKDITDVENKLINMHMGLVHKISSKYRNAFSYHQDVTQNDIINQGILGLYRAIDRFDISKGFKFSTFAFYHIQESIYSFLQDENKHYMFSLNAHLHSDDEETEDERLDFVFTPSTTEIVYDLTNIEKRLQRLIGQANASLLISILEGSSTEGFLRLHKIKRKTLHKKIEELLATVQKKDKMLYEEIHEIFCEIILKSS